MMTLVRLQSPASGSLLLVTVKVTEKNTKIMIVKCHSENLISLPVIFEQLVGRGHTGSLRRSTGQDGFIFLISHTNFICFQKFIAHFL